MYLFVNYFTKRNYLPKLNAADHASKHPDPKKALKYLFSYLSKPLLLEATFK